MKNVEVAKPEFSASLVEFEIKLAKETEAIDLDPQTVKKSIEYLAQKTDFENCFVKLEPETGKPIGSLILVYENKEVFWGISAYVEENYRKQGVFRDLFEKSINHSKEKNVKAIKLCVEKNNLRAIKAHEKMGFKLTGEIFYGYDFLFEGFSQPLNLWEQIP